MDDKEKLEQISENEEDITVSDELNEEIQLEVVDAENSESDEAVYETSEEDVYRESVPEEEVQILSETEKKPLGLQKPILIACCIFLAAVIAFGGLMVYNKLFNPGVEGVWVLAEQASMDEAKSSGNGVTYFTFDKDGKASMTIGSMTVVGDWSYSETDAEVEVAISYFFSGTFTAEVEGNIFTGRTLSLTDDSGSYDFVSSSIPEMYPKTDKDAKTDSKLTGVWSNSDSGNVYTFNEDGTCVIEQASILTINGRYSVKDGTVTVSYIANEEVETAMTYEINDDGTITIDSLVYTKQ